MTILNRIALFRKKALCEVFAIRLGYCAISVGYFQISVPYWKISVGYWKIRAGYYRMAASEDFCPDKGTPKDS